MDALDLARWQFGITTVYHFIFVPLTIGLAPLVAIMQTAWHRTGDERWLRLTKFFGKLLLINFAIGVATGIVQEFQFGMNWSEYSRFVGDVFGAPLAMEALAAFFVESTFLGLWIFGWDKLPQRVHLATIWAVAIATNLSAFFILAANSWMQHPVGAVLNEETGRAEMVDIGAVLTNPTLLAAFPHTITAAFLTAGTFVAGIGAWWMVRSVRRGDEATARVYRSAVVLGTVTMLAAGVGVAASGDWQAKLMFDQQPMKMASAEALCEGETGAAFSLLTIGDLSNDCEGVRHVLTVPGLTSYLASGTFDSYLPGVEELQERSEVLYGEGVDYRPNLAVTYWSFRLMIGLGLGSAALAAAVLLLLRRRAVVGTRWFGTLGLAALPTPFLASSFGWVFTEMGRQPWVVAPNPNPSGVDGVWMLTATGVSTSVPAGMVLTSMIGFTLLYAVLAVLWFRLMVRYAVEGVAATETDPSPEAQRLAAQNPDDGADKPLSFAY
ncbi:cytochrome BD ubiquinol oxidase subunit I [Actinotalea ferrariae CF5-4]|uniref:Cytochrome BD ubiquinol oxidase subunit I n=1 Tax=Actinotalea ferrariae CF5-4 TaxID=948458 RepID=A0A021VTD9_9CELL|nr:cytochrome ubiquinol oxidase subunit I [Actinotalea ferrariae]EYR62332.1 cytochrome BD ubiquinol oxidase subunit I [Actinotalea ferrariae CF5-4]